MAKINLLLISIISILSCAKVNHLPDHKYSSYQLNDTIKVDETVAVNALIEPYKIVLDAEINVVIGQSAKRLNMAFPESTLGNFVADVLYQQAEKSYEGKIDFAFINYWSIRLEEIQRGDITKGQVFELMPFENHLVIMKVDRFVVRQLFENMAVKGGWPISKQVKFQIKDGKPKNISINGKPLEEGYTYHIAVSNYIANGGDSCSFFKDEDRDDIDVLIRDMIVQGIVDYKEKGEAISANVEGRVSLIE